MEQNLNVVKVKKLKENAVLPKRATEGSAGADLYACIDEPITIRPGDLVKIPTGIAIELADKNLAAFLVFVMFRTRNIRSVRWKEWRRWSLCPLSARNLSKQRAFPTPKEAKAVSVRAESSDT